MITYDPDEKPQIDPEVHRQAEKYGWKPVSVVCAEPNAEGGDSVAFIAYVDFIPRVGDKILLQDGAACEVKRVLYKISNVGNLIHMVPNVYAIKIPKD